MSFSDIVAYTFQADTHCPDCTKRMYWQHAVNVAATAEMILDAAAKVLGIDRYDERSYDSGYFPKVVFENQIEDTNERCGSCGEPFIDVS